MSIAAALVVIVIAATLTILGWIKLGSSSSGATEAGASNAAAATTAMAEGAQLAVDFTSFDYRRLDADFAAAAKHATPTFAKVYLAQSKFVEPAVKKAKAISTSQVMSTALEAFSPTAGTATVLVALNDTTKNTKSPAGTVLYFRMQVTMQRHNGRWLATNVAPE